MLRQITLALIVFVIMQSTPVPLYAEESARQYKTRDEKREAASRYGITDWLSLSAIAEIEQTHQRFKPLDAARSSAEDFSKSLDVEVGIEASESLKGEVVFEFDDAKGKFLVDEALAIIDWGKAEIELGKIYLPLGEYFSHFVTGSPIEFAETRAKAIAVSHSPKEGSELSLFAYKGEAEKAGTDSHDINWGMAAEITPGDSFTVGLSYISDLADADGMSLSDNQRLTKRVGGLGVWSVVEYDDFELTAEYIAALDNFEVLEPDLNKPSGWNLELAHFPTEKLEWALRLAASKEVEEEPRQQMGIAGTWHINKKASLTLEYLRNGYKSGLMEDDQENILDKSSQLAGRLSILF